MRMIAALAVLTVLLAYVWQRVDLVRVGYDIQQLKTRHLALKREHHELQVKVSTLSAPERIATLASEELGMRQPHPQQIVLVNVSREPSGDRPPALAVRVAKREVNGAAP